MRQDTKTFLGVKAHAYVPIYICVGAICILSSIVVNTSICDLPYCVLFIAIQKRVSKFNPSQQTVSPMLLIATSWNRSHSCVYCCLVTITRGIGRWTPVSLAPANQWSNQSQYFFSLYFFSHRVENIQGPRDFETYSDLLAKKFLISTRLSLGRYLFWRACQGEINSAALLCTSPPSKTCSALSRRLIFFPRQDQEPNLCGIGCLFGWLCKGSWRGARH